MNTTEKSPFVQFLHDVRRSRTDRRLGGVCGGLATSTEIPSWVYRALFLSLAVVAVGAIFYVALWLCMPEEPLPAREPRPAAEPHPSPAN